jgi:hypothetical protein
MDMKEQKEGKKEERKEEGEWCALYWPRLAHGQEERGGAMDSGLEISVPKRKRKCSLCLKYRRRGAPGEREREREREKMGCMCSCARPPLPCSLL